MDSLEVKSSKMVSILTCASDDLVIKLKYLKECLASSFGPFGRTKIVSLADEDLKCGSSSSLLFNSELIQDSNGIIKLLVSSAKEHLKVHKDFGLYCLIFSISLVESSLNIDVTSCLIAECFRHFLRVVSSLLQDINSCPIIKKFDISKSDSFLLLLKNILSSKPCLLFNENDMQMLSCLLLQSFIVCMPNDLKFEKISWPSILFAKSNKIEDSKMFEGLLLDLVHCSQDSIDNMLVDGKLKQQSWVVVLNMALTVNAITKDLPNKLSTVSQSRISSIIKFLEQFALKLKSHNIAIVFNQKVMCDELKHILKSYSIITIDRIGLSQMEALKKVTKCKVISSFVEEIDKCKSFINELSIESINSKSFVCIKRYDVNISTVVICYSNPAFLDDLKHVCWAAINALDKTIKRQQVLVGGSAMEDYLVTKLGTFLEKNDFPKTSGYFACSLGQWQMCLSAFCSALTYMKKLYVNEPVCDVYDCYESKLNAFIVAIEAACIALEIKYQIHD